MSWNWSRDANELAFFRELTPRINRQGRRVEYVVPDLQTRKVCSSSFVPRACSGRRTGMGLTRSIADGSSMLST